MVKILNVEIHFEQDVVHARQRARQIASLLHMDGQDQTRIATAVSEIARNAYRYAGGGRVEFFLDDGPPQVLLIRISDNGPGIPNLEEITNGQFRSTTGLGMGIVGARRLMDSFEIQSTPGRGTVVTLGKHLPPNGGRLRPEDIGKIADQLARMTPEDPLQEIQRQNQELVRALDEVRQRQEELVRLNRELEDTNRGVVALYAELDEKADYLRRASEVKSRFLSNMSHEFRTPLNSILTLSRLLLDRIDGEINAEQEKQVTFIQKAAESLTELVNDLLDLAKVEAGKIAVNPAPFRVDNMFGALRGMLRPLLISNTAVSISFEDPMDLPGMNTDEGKLSQILRNFVSNAIKFTEKGEIRVSAARGPENTLVFSVADTGIGIAPEDQERIFQEYAQVEEAQRHHRAKGTGLGLPLSRKLAQLLGGDVHVKSQLGVGSTFYAVIPIEYSGPTEVSYVPEVTRKLDPNRIPVLIVEDNRETIFIYEKYLKGTPFQVIPARSTKEARNALKEFRPLAIVLDILLENEYAWNLLGDIKGDEATRDIPVFVVTVVDNQRKALSMGADDFFIKPVEREWLLGHLYGLEQRLPSQKILLVDDDEISRYLLRGALAGTRYSILEAKSGFEGLELARQEKPHVIILDLMMPEMDGFAMLKKLKADPATSEIPVIINTSRILTQAEHKRLDDHVVAILSKHTPSREKARANMAEALSKAGLIGRMPEEDATPT